MAIRTNIPVISSLTFSRVHENFHTFQLLSFAEASCHGPGPAVMLDWQQKAYERRHLKLNMSHIFPK